MDLPAKNDILLSGFHKYSSACQSLYDLCRAIAVQLNSLMTTMTPRNPRGNSLTWPKYLGSVDNEEPPYPQDTLIMLLGYICVSRP